MTEAETGGRRPQARDTWSHQSWKRQEGPSPGASEGGPAHTLISDAGLQNWEIIHPCGLRPTHLWSLVWAATGH